MEGRAAQACHNLPIIFNWKVAMNYVITSNLFKPNTFTKSIVVVLVNVFVPAVEAF
jgi:hypothetical protein